MSSLYCGRHFPLFAVSLWLATDDNRHRFTRHEYGRNGRTLKSKYRNCCIVYFYLRQWRNFSAIGSFCTNNNVPVPFEQHLSGYLAEFRIVLAWFVLICSASDCT